MRRTKGKNDKSHSEGKVDQNIQRQQYAAKDYGSEGQQEQADKGDQAALGDFFGSVHHSDFFFEKWLHLYRPQKERKSYQKTKFG